MSTSIQESRPYTKNLTSEMLGDSKNEFLHWGDVLGLKYAHGAWQSEAQARWPCGRRPLGHMTIGMHAGGSFS